MNPHPTPEIIEKRVRWLLNFFTKHESLKGLPPEDRDRFTKLAKTIELEIIETRLDELNRLESNDDCEICQECIDNRIEDLTRQKEGLK